MHHMRVVPEPDIRQHQLAFALDIHLARTVDHDLGDALIIQQGLDGTESHHFIHDFRNDAAALKPGNRHRLLIHGQIGDTTDRLFKLPLFDLGGAQFVHDPLVDFAFQRSEWVIPRRNSCLGALPRFCGRRCLIIFLAFQPFQQRHVCSLR